MSHIFISYSHNDAEYAQKFAHALKDRTIAYWMDDHSIETGDRWVQEVLSALTSSAAIVVIMTPESDKSEWVNREILIAQEKRKPIFPLLLRGDKFLLLIDRQYEDVKSGEMPSGSFFEQLAKIIELDAPDKRVYDQATSPNPAVTLATLSEAHRQADLQLLAELWKHISSNRLNLIMSRVNARDLEYDYYNKHIIGYLYKRELPEKHFIDSKLEDAFEVFDQTLLMFDTQMFADSSVERIADRDIVVPSYKLRDESGHHIVFSKEEYDRRLASHEETLKNAQKVLTVHKELVKIMKQVLPEFSFPEVPIW